MANSSSPTLLQRYRQFHWKVVRVLLRITGYAFVGGGSIFTIWGVRLLLDPLSTVLIDGIPSKDAHDKAEFLFVGLGAVAIGTILLFGLRLFARLKLVKTHAKRA